MRKDSEERPCDETAGEWDEDGGSGPSSGMVRVRVRLYAVRPCASACASGARLC